MNDPGEWRRRIIVGDRIGEPAPPEWLISSYQTFRERVLHPQYPCFFGSNAERRGELFYSFVSCGLRDHLPHTLRTFIGIAARRPTERNNLAVFFEPTPQSMDHEAAGRAFWSHLQFLHDNDPMRDCEVFRISPSEPRWEFPFAGEQLFVVGASPSYQRRRSRNLGPGLVMLFQPRDVFVDNQSGEPLGLNARAEVRARLARWDELPAHADLGVYGSPENREWKQYFLPDNEALTTGPCQLSTPVCPYLGSDKKEREEARYDDEAGDFATG